jgi:hypothetical protein
MKLADIIRKSSCPSPRGYFEVTLFFFTCKLNDLQINCKHLYFKYYLKIT